MVNHNESLFCPALDQHISRKVTIRVRPQGQNGLSPQPNYGKSWKTTFTATATFGKGMFFAERPSFIERPSLIERLSLGEQHRPPPLLGEGRLQLTKHPTLHPRVSSPIWPGCRGPWSFWSLGILVSVINSSKWFIWEKKTRWKHLLDLWWSW